MPTTKKNHEILISVGDPDGIGPEVTEKALDIALTKHKKNKPSYICFGDKSLFSKALQKHVEFVVPPKRKSTAWQSGWSALTAATKTFEQPNSRAWVTAPIHKKRVESAKFKFHSHTDLLSLLNNNAPVSMMLMNSIAKVTLVTIHTPLKDVPKRITKSALQISLKHTCTFLHQRFGVSAPKIGILGLNPHAGEDGLIGNEELKVIRPWIKSKKNKNFSGPYSADTYFLRNNRHDATIAMYHDQGLIPIKLLDPKGTINVSLGTPIIRTSVDHGTAFDIAGKNIADASSMSAALAWAEKFLANT